MAKEVLSKWVIGAMLAFACASAIPALAYADGTIDEQVGEGDGVQQVSPDGSASKPADDAMSTAGATEPPAGQAQNDGNVNEVNETNAKDKPGDTTAPVVSDEPTVVEETPQVPAAEEKTSAKPESETSPIPEGAVLYSVHYEPIVAQSAATNSKTTSAAKTAAVAKTAAPTFSLTVQAHVQNVGWQKHNAVVTPGGAYGEVGTHGKSLRVEELRFMLSDGALGGIQVQAHVQNVGWQTIRWGGAGKTITAGTHGKSQRIESIRIMLTGEISKYYDIAYNAHVQNIGWQKNTKDASTWYKNGQIAGTSGRSLRVEALQLALLKKTTPAPNPTDGIVGIRSQAHVQNVGWQSWVQNGQTAGTSGRSLRIEALKLALDSGVYSGGLNVIAHIQNIGNREYKGKSLTAGTTGRSLRMESFKIGLTGKIAKEYDVVYRAHVQNVGWQPWVVNGAEAGTHGRSLRIEALQVKLVKKNTSQALSEGTYFISLVDNAGKALDNSAYQAKMANFATNSMTERYYLRNEGNGYVSLQNVGSGLFLARNGANIVRQADSKADSHRWKLWWDGGYTLENKAGSKAATKSGNGVLTANGYRWMLTGTALIPNANYYVKNVNAAKVLDVQGTGYASYASNANLQVNKAASKADQVFTFTNKGNNTYEIKSAQSLKAVEVANGKGSRVRTWVDNNSKAQKWKVSLSRSGGLQFKNVASGGLLTAESTANNSNVTSRSAASNVKTQLWTLAPSKYKTNAGYARAYNHIKWRSSGTQYMFALDQTRTWLYIFKGSPGNWTLDRDWIVSVGRDSNRTPRGEFEIYDKQYEDGNGNYSVWYFTRFKWDNAFHSIKYDAGSMTSVYDGRLGQHISLGCVRQRLENARWIYYNAGYGTHVSSYD